MKPVGILLVSTGGLATSVSTLITELLGKPATFKSLAIRREDHWEEASAKVRKAVDAIDQGGGVLILTEIPGGTPFNVACSLRRERNVEVIGGINLPLVMKAVQIAAEHPLPELAALLEKYGRDHIQRGLG
ncbi:MAG: hypothetical protein V1495_04280 [Pseudomonadota bacterium]